MYIGKIHKVDAEQQQALHFYRFYTFHLSNVVLRRNSGSPIAQCLYMVAFYIKAQYVALSNWPLQSKNVLC